MGNLDYQKVNGLKVEGALWDLLKSSHELITRSEVFYDRLTSMVWNNSGDFFNKITNSLYLACSQKTNFNPQILEKLKSYIK